MDKISFGASFKLTVGSKGRHLEDRREISQIIASAFNDATIAETPHSRLQKSPPRDTFIDIPMDRSEHLTELETMKKVLSNISEQGKYSVEKALQRVSSCIRSARNGEYHQAINLEIFKK